MGTPGFAVPTLEMLHSEGHDIELVVTQPDKPSGRGKKLRKSEVKEKAEELGLKIFQPEKIKSKENVEYLKTFNPDVIVVVAYGQILSRNILEIPRLGCINVHASLLPKLRGAAPLNWAIINGEKKSGVTTMMMDVGLDTGDMLLKTEIEIGKDMTVGELHDILMVEGGHLLIETLNKLEKNEITPKKQDESITSYAPMIDKETLKIDFKGKPENIHNLIRGLSPWPAAFFTMDGMNVKVYRSSYTNEVSGLSQGTVIKVSDEGIFVAVSEGTVILKEIQMPGKNRMTVQSYLRGNKFPENIMLNS
jgi:methionyl-tRNA formyltransferase